MRPEDFDEKLLEALQHPEKWYTDHATLICRKENIRLSPNGIDHPVTVIGGGVLLGTVSYKAYTACCTRIREIKQEEFRERKEQSRQRFFQGFKGF